MKAGKTISIVIALLLVAAGVVTFTLYKNLDRIAAEAIVGAGEELLDTRVSLDSVEVTLMEGKAVLSGLEIANPAGFSDGPAVNLGLIEVDIDLKSINDEVLVIDKVLVRDPRVNFEMNQSGDSNIDALKANVESASPSAANDSDKLLIIDRLEFSGGGISATAALKPGQSLDFDFPSLTMNGIGRPGGATADQVGAEISAVLMDRIISAATRAGVDRLLEKKKEELIEKAEEKIGEKLKDLLKKN
jgi:hypothetical protein